jgi:DNA polymerase III delta subunit
MARKTAAVLSVKDIRWTRATLPRVVLIIGPESALRDEAIAAAKKAAIGEQGEAGLNWLIKYGPQNQNEANPLMPADVLDELCTPNMFASGDELKVVLVRQGDVFLKRHFAVLEDNLKNIPSTSTLVLEATGYGNLKSTRFFGLLAEQGGVVDCEALAGKYGDSPELEAEVQRRATAKGLNLQHAALVALMNRSAKNLAVLDEELDKLSLALKPAGAPGEKSEPITVIEQHIEEICASTATFNAFNFADAIIDRKAPQALEVLGSLLERGLADSTKPGRVTTNEGSIAILLFGALNYKLSQLQDLRANLDAGVREFDAFRNAKIPPFRQNAMQYTLRKHDSGSLRRCVDALFQANLDIRSSGSTARDVLEKMVWAFVKS